MAAASLTRDLSRNVSNVTVNLVPAGTTYGNRINQLDLRLAKILRSARTRTMLAIDVYNALNSSAALAYNPDRPRRAVAAANDAADPALREDHW